MDLNSIMYRLLLDTLATDDSKDQFRVQGSNVKFNNYHYAIFDKLPLSQVYYFTSHYINKVLIIIINYVNSTGHPRLSVLPDTQWQQKT